MIFRQVLVFCLLWMPINCVIAQTGGSRLSGEKLLSQEALVLVEIPNVESFINTGKSCFYDIYFGDQIREGVLRELDFPILGKALAARADKEHWLCNTIASFACKENPTIKELTKLTKLFDRQSYQLDDNDQQQMVELLASLFPGRFCWGVEPNEGFLEFVFAFEFDPTHFDWQQELMNSLPDAGSGTKPVASVGQVDIYALPIGGIHFFCLNDVVYGTSSKNANFCVELARRVMNLEPNHKTLADSLYFARVKSELNWNDAPNRCLFFIRTVDLSKSNIHSEDDQERESSKLPDDYFADSRVSGWSDFGGGTITLGPQQKVGYRVVFPLHIPLAEGVEKLMSKSEGGLNAEQSYLVPASGPSLVQGISPGARDHWKSLPYFTMPKCIEALGKKEQSVTSPYGFKLDQTKWWEKLNPEEVQTFAVGQNDNFRSISRLLFDKHLLVYLNNWDKGERAKPIELRQLQLNKIFSDLKKGEHVIGFSFSNQSNLYQDTGSPFCPLTRFVGRCSSSNLTCLGSALVVGDFAIGFDPQAAKRSLCKENPSLVNLYGAVASNFYESGGFARAWDSTQRISVDLHNVFMVSESNNTIICRGVMQRPKAAPTPQK